MKRGATVLAIAVASLGCSDEAPVPQEQPPTHDPVSYPLTEQPYTALQALWEPLPVSAQTRALIDEGELRPPDIDRFEEAGLGVQLAAGQPWIEQLELAPGFSEGSERNSLLYIWQAADPQLIDEESPIRLEAFDPLYRPQGHLTLHSFESHVRTAARLSDISGRPFDFALLAGDLSDGSQRNELDWMVAILNGGAIDPDSGRDDDPVPGPGNDYSDPFLSVGLSVPWYAVIGNHETLYNGGFGAITEELRAFAVGTEVYNFPLFKNGFRDGTTVNADVRSEGPAQADERRTPLYLEEVLSLIQQAGGSPAGHGMSADDAAAGIGYFSVHPMEGKPIRLIALNTVFSDATTVGVGSLGIFDEEQFDWLRQQLDDADANAELVVVMSHHKSDDLSDTSPVTGAELSAVLEASDGVVLHVTGHGHRNEKAVYSQASMGLDAFGYWELMLASTIDFPMHSRVIEIVDEGNGYVSIYCTNLGHNAPVDSLAHRARQLAAAKAAFPSFDTEGDIEAAWAEDLPSQNLLLRVPIAPALAANLATHRWQTRIESEQTLLTLDGDGT